MVVIFKTLIIPCEINVTMIRHNDNSTQTAPDMGSAHWVQHARGRIFGDEQKIKQEKMATNGMVQRLLSLSTSLRAEFSVVLVWHVNQG